MRPHSFSWRRYFSFEKHIGDNVWLDLLRALAIIFVLARHGQRGWIAAQDETATAFDFILINGWIGVDLFLVLSGYLIGRILITLNENPKSHSICHYYWKRALRILPAYYAVLIITALGLVPLFTPSHDQLAWRILYHLFMAQDYLPSDINVVFWSLGVEIKFYLIAPFLVALLLRQKSQPRFIWGLFSLTALSPILRTLDAAFLGVPNDYTLFWSEFRSPFHASLEPLVLGLGLAVAEYKNRMKISPKQALICFISVFTVLGIWSGSAEFMAEITWFDIILQPTLIAALFAVAVFAAIQLKTVAMPGERLVRVIARLSYSLYLVHFPLIPLALAINTTGMHSVTRYWVQFLSLSFCAALVLHFSVEKPFLRMRPKSA